MGSAADVSLGLMVGLMVENEYRMLSSRRVTHMLRGLIQAASHFQIPCCWVPCAIWIWNFRLAPYFWLIWEAEEGQNLRKHPVGILLWGARSARGRDTKVAADVTKNCHHQYYYQAKTSNRSDTKTK